jgi:hypothetical protein
MEGFEPAEPATAALRSALPTLDMVTDTVITVVDSTEVDSTAVAAVTAVTDRPAGSVSAGP